MSSSWLLSLKKCRLAMSCVPHHLLDAAPGRAIAETGPQIIQHGGDLTIRHAVGKARHDRAALTRDGTNSRQDDVGGIARIGRAQRGAQTEIDPAIRRRPPRIRSEE